MIAKKWTDLVFSTLGGQSSALVFYMYLNCIFISSLKTQYTLIIFVPDSTSLPHPLLFSSLINHVSFPLLFLKPSLTVDAACICLDVWPSTEGDQPARGCTLEENWLSLPQSHPSPVASELRVRL